jgi:coenzyme F420 hydrogenase subunit beta
METLSKRINDELSVLIEMENTQMIMKGPKALQREVIKKGICSACGACLNICPYIDFVAGRTVMIEPCPLDEGKCYDFCPRTYVDTPLFDEKLFGAPRSDLALGSYVEIVKAKALDEKILTASQYGGTTSALITYALETGEIDAAILARSSADNLKTKPALATNKKEVLQCAGSKYIACPILREVESATKNGVESIGIVGTSCQVTALRKMQFSSTEPINEVVRITIGLFCTWALKPQAHDYFAKLVDPKMIIRFDVPPPPANTFVIDTNEGRREISLDKIREFIMPACNACFDMTNEFSDISVGTVEGEANWNTVIIRTNTGKKFFQRAIKAGIIETTSLEDEKMNHLKQASLERKRKVLSEMESKRISYLTIRDEDKSKLLT